MTRRQNSTGAVLIGKDLYGQHRGKTILERYGQNSMGAVPIGQDL